MKIKKEISDKTLDLIIHAIYLMGYVDGKQIVMTGELLQERMDACRRLIKKESK